MRFTSLLAGATAVLVSLTTASTAAVAQTTLYHLHGERDAYGTYPLNTAAPDTATVAILSSDYKNTTISGVAPPMAWFRNPPNNVSNTLLGTIPAGTTATFALWMKKSGNWGTFYPYARFQVGGNVACEATGGTALTTTLTKYTFSCQTATVLTVGPSDVFWAVIAVNIGASPGNHSTNVQLSVEGVLNGNYDSQATLPRPAPPVITSVTPASGPVASLATVIGSNFGATQGSGTLKFNGVTATPSSWNNTTIVAPVPAAATTGPVQVALGTNQSNTVTYTVTPPPAITGISPTAAPRGTSVMVSGTNFGAAQGNSILTFNNVIAAPTAWSNTSITVPVPPAATTGPVVITNGGAISNATSFTVITTGTLTGTVTRAADGTPVGGASVRAFQGGSLKASTTTSGSGAYTLANLEQGTYDVTVSAASFASELRQGVVITAAASTTLDVGLVAPGTISGVVTQADGMTPVVGAAVTALQGGTSRGTASTDSTGHYAIGGLHPATYVVQASSVGWQTAEQSGVVVTNGGTAAANFSLTTAPAGTVRYVYDELGRLVSVTDTAGNSANYTYDAVGNVLSIARSDMAHVSIAEFSPNVGSAGSTIVIYGSGFSSTPEQNVVTFNGVAAAVTTAASGQLVVVVPAGASTGPIAVSTPNGSATSAASFTVTTPPVTTAISGFSPTIGSVGTAVTITGTGFDTIAARDRLTFNATLASVITATATSLTANVPISATSGHLTVATVNGTATSATDFFVPPSPYTPADVTLTDRMNIGDTRTVAINTANTVGLVLFDGTAGQRISIPFSGSTFSSITVAVYEPSGTRLTSINFWNPTAFMDALTLPRTGTYTLLFDPDSTYTGAVTLTLRSVVDVSGPITTDGTPVTADLTTPGQNARFTFAGTAGQKISLTLNANVGMNCVWALALVKPDGSTLASTSSCSGATSEMLDTQTLPVSGTYTVLVDPWGTTSGIATVRAYSITDVTGPITIDGTPVTADLNTPGQNARFTFTGTAGQRISLTLNANVGMNCVWTLALIKPDGSTQASTASCTGATSEMVDTQTLPVSGTYTVLVDPSGQTLGIATVRAYGITDVTGPIATDGTPATADLNTPGQNARFTFSGTAGQKISLTLNANVGMNCVWTLALVKPDGSTLASTASCSGSTSEMVDTQTLPVSGTYTVLVDPSGTTTGIATVRAYSITDVTGPIATDGTPATADLNTPGQNARFTFSGTAGQKISLTLSANVGMNCVWTLALVKPDGSTLASTASCTGGTSEMVDTQTLPVSGTYTVLVDPSGTTMGIATVRAYSITDVTGAIATDGTPAVAALNTPGQNARFTFSGTAGQKISLTLSANVGMNCVWTLALVKPDGSTLASTASCTGGTSEMVDTQTLPVSGTYTVLVDPSGTTTGTATVRAYSITDVTGPIATDGTPAVAALNTPGQNARFTFNGASGQTVNLSLTANIALACNWTLSLLRPDGSTQASVASCTGGMSESLAPQSLSSTGTYTVLVDPWSTTTGTASVTATTQ